MIFGRYLIRLWHQAAWENNQNLALLLEKDPQAKILDLGCDNGQLVKERMKKFVGSQNIWGVDIDKKALAKAQKRGIKTCYQDLNQSLPFKSNFFDLVQANQVIEHLWNTDTILAETYRVLKPKGYFLVATENLSSWHNLLPLFLGFQAPSQDISSQYRVGNPFSLCQKRPRLWTAHQRIFTLFGLRELLQKYQFEIEAVKTAGYYPLPSLLAKLFTRADPRHSAFICFKARK